MPALAARTEAKLPQAPSLLSMIGPSFILLGLGLGSGELLLWPYLAAHYGLGVMWAAAVGITFQYFLNLEIERYTLSTGESVFVGLTRSHARFAPIWFLLSTIIPWIWPGIISISALIISTSLHLGSFQPVAIVLLLSIAVILTSSSTVYQTMERWQKISLGIAVPFLILLTFSIAKPDDWLALWNGLRGIGDGYSWLPPKLPLFTLLGALAYAGAGGNLNLAQSFYIKDKGYGMGQHANCSTSQVRGHHPITKIPRVEGYFFKITESSLLRFKQWWWRLTIEHSIVFWITGLVTMLLLATLAFATTKQYQGVLPSGTQFLFVEANLIAAGTHQFVGILFLSIVALMLFSTQLSIADSTSRILAENLVLLNKKVFNPKQLPKWYKLAVWGQVLAGCSILLFKITEPFMLVTLSAILNALSMLAYSIMLLRLNTTQLPPPLRPSLIRRLIILGCIIFLSIFAILTVWQFLN